MPVSTRFRALQRRLSELRKYMLPSTFSPTGIYSSRQQDRARGYRVLAHAEIESYLEDMARESVTDAIRCWKSSGRPSMILLSFLAAYHSGWDLEDERTNDEIIRLARRRTRVKDTVNEAIDIAQKQFVTVIQNNHGIKETNFKRLVLPLGVDVDALDSTWITNLDNFGSSRGETAHKAKMASGEINPEDEYETVKQLLVGLKELDSKIQVARSR